MQKNGKKKERQKRMKTEVITRKDGIVYERKKRELTYDCRLNIKFKRSEIEKLKEIAQKEGKRYQTMIREVIGEFIEYYERSEEDE